MNFLTAEDTTAIGAFGVAPAPTAGESSRAGIKTADDWYDRAGSGVDPIKTKPS